MNREQYSSTFDAGLSISGSFAVPPPGSHGGSGRDEDFQKLLARIAAKAGERSGSRALIQFFCNAAREFFKVTGVYFWRCELADELVGEQADGKLVERFIGMRLGPEQSVVTASAVRQRRTMWANHVEPGAFPAAKEFDVRSLMAAPLLVFNEVIGAVTFLHDSDDNFFSDELAAKATILAGQLGTLLEAEKEHSHE